MHQYQLLIVDDDSLVREGMAELLISQGYRVETAHTAEQARNTIQASPKNFALVLADYHLPDQDGANLAKSLVRLAPNTFVLMLSGDSSREVLKQSMKSGASDFLEKGGNLENLLQVVQFYYHSYIENTTALEKPAVSSENERIIASIGLAGKSSKFANIARNVRHHRNHRYTVMLIGESGTGKERIASALHQGSPKKFFAVNCATYRDNSQLLESELFGYEKGAFTGADRTQRGMFELADGGTLFLDEIHELSISAQAKLLRVLQDKKIRRVGGAMEISVDVRVVAAAKPIIEKKKESGEFLLDLYNRLYVFPIELPPLRDRKEDIAPIVQFFSEKYGAELGKTVKFLQGTVKQMEQYHWPGNVRELENTVLRLLVNSKNGVVAPDHFGEDCSLSEPTHPPKNLQEIRQRFESDEKKFILNALGKSRFNLRGAARDLGISHTTLYGKVKKYGLLPAKEEANAVYS